MLLEFTEWVQPWVTDYGYPGIFVALMLGIVGLPIPDETLLAFVGYLASRGRLLLVPAIFSALLGSACGITLSYVLGRTTGDWLVRKLGRLLHITPHKIEAMHSWFERFGRWTILVGYFIPGVRHLTAFAAGTARLAFPTFAIFAYTGAVVWSSTFILAGFFLGRKWLEVGSKGHLLIAGIALSAVLATSAAVYLIGKAFRRHARRAEEARGGPASRGLPPP